ncbi:MAG: hypothetical protein C0407_17465 [Desulfobacca sp.]|nr:hypothetical protein [Desulfobacca sp.]
MPAIPSLRAAILRDGTCSLKFFHSRGSKVFRKISHLPWLSIRLVAIPSLLSWPAFFWGLVQLRYRSRDPCIILFEPSGEKL